MMNFVTKLSGFVGKNLTWLVLLTIVGGYFVPSGFTWAVKNTVWLLGVVMFGMGMTLHASDFKLVLQRPREVLAGTVCHYTIMPLVAYALVMVFGLTPELAVGMVLLGSCPSGTASNVMSFLAKGDVPLAVSITTVSTLLAPVMMPFLVWALAGQWVTVSFLSMAMTVMKVILVPLVLGLLVHRLVGETYLAQMQKVLVLVSAFAVLSILGGVVAVNGAKIVSLGVFMVVLVLLHNLFGFALGYFITGKLGFGKRQQHSVTLEVGMQNDALALSICSIYFAPAVAIPAAVGAAVHQITGSMLAGLFARNMDKYEARQQAASTQKETVPALGYFITGKLGFGKRQQHSVTLEVGMQNDALALSICSIYFAPAVAIPAAVGAAVHQITGSMLAGLFARNMDKYEARQQAASTQKETVPAPSAH